jgi:DNA invertase Pin-like site-specific DNA recombinase
LALISRSVRVLTAAGDDLTDSSDPSRVMMRQIAGAFHQYEKARLVAKLKAARDRKRATGVKVEGRKSWKDADKDTKPEQARKAQALRNLTKTHRRSLRDIAAELAKQGHLNKAGKVFSPSVIASMLATKP